LAWYGRSEERRRPAPTATGPTSQDISSYPKDITALLNQEIVQIVQQSEMKERLATLGFDVVGSTAEEFDKRIKSEIDSWGKVIRAAAIKPE
jgi:tripartite-type tricarboxylate transporter receptor subunit TctC